MTPPEMARQLTMAVHTGIDRYCARAQRRLSERVSRDHPTRRVESALRSTLGPASSAPERILGAVRAVCDSDGRTDVPALSRTIGHILLDPLRHDADAFIAVLYRQGKHRHEINQLRSRLGDERIERSPTAFESGRIAEELFTPFRAEFEGIRSVAQLSTKLRRGVVRILGDALTAEMGGGRPREEILITSESRWELLLVANAAPGSGEEPPSPERAVRDAVSSVIRADPKCRVIADVWIDGFWEYWNTVRPGRTLIVDVTNRILEAEIATATTLLERARLEAERFDLRSAEETRMRPTNSRSCQRVRAKLRALRRLVQQQLTLGRADDFGSAS